MNNCNINITSPHFLRDNSQTSSSSNGTQSDKILDFDCLFNGIDIFDEKNYFLSKTSIDYLRYIIMFHSDDIYKYILGLYGDNTEPYKYSIPVIKKTANDNLGIVDYDKVHSYLVKNYDEVMDYRENMKRINNYRTRVARIDEKIGGIRDDYNHGPDKDNQKKLDKKIKGIDDQLKKLPGIIILPNNRYEINGSQEVVDKFNSLLDELQKLYDEEKIIIDKRNDLINKHDDLLEKRNDIVTNINKLLKQNTAIPMIESAVSRSHLVDDESIKKLNKNQIIDLFIDHEKDHLISQINQCNNTMIVLIDLDFFIEQSGKLEKQNIGHANSLIIRKSNDGVLIIRTEPHRHSNTYCRNSIRKAIKEIFLKMDNTIYLDYIISSKNGLQIGEEIDEFEDNDYTSLSKGQKYRSPLKGNSGFCASWTLYISLMILLNPSLGVEQIGNYLQYLNSPLRIKSVDQIIDEIQHRSKDNPSSDHLSDDLSSDLSEDLSKLVKNNMIQMNLSNQNDPLYIITKHHKLYMMLMTGLYILRHIENNRSIVFDNYVKKKLGYQYKNIKRNVSRNENDKKNDNTISNRIMKNIENNFPNFLDNVRKNINKNVNLNTGSLHDKHMIEDAGASHVDVCSPDNIKKHDKEIKQINDKKFKIIKSYDPNIIGYLSGGAGTFKNDYKENKTIYLSLTKISKDQWT